MMGKLKKFLTLLLVLIISLCTALSMTACEKPGDGEEQEVFKVGIICTGS